MSAPVDHAAIAVARDGKRLTYAEAAMMVAAERGDRPVARIPFHDGLCGKSKERMHADMDAMNAAITAREEWDRAVKRLMACPIAAAVTEMHLTAGGR